MRRRALPLLLLLSLLLPTLPAADAAVTTTGADNLLSGTLYVNGSADAIALVGIGATSSAATTDSLTQVDLSRQSGVQTSLAAISTDPALSGVALFRDDGAIDDVLDPTDTGLTPSTATWTGPSARLIWVPATNPEWVPTVVVGSYQWLLVIHTSATIADGESLTVRLNKNGVSFDDGSKAPAADLGLLTITADTVAPAPWGAPPGNGWHLTQRPTLSTTIADSRSGLQVDSAEAAISLDGGSTWGPWLAIGCSGANGTTVAQTLTASDLPFDTDGDLATLLAKLRIRDRAHNLAEGGPFGVGIDTLAPTGWSAPTPNGWQGTRTPLVGIDVRDVGSGLKVDAAQVAVSEDAGASWSAWSSATLSGTDGTTALEHLSATPTFTLDSPDGTLVRFSAIDLAGNVGLSAASVVPIDTVVPGPLLPATDLGWFSSQQPTLQLTLEDGMSGVDPDNGTYRSSSDGGATWSTDRPLEIAASIGTPGRWDLTARDVPFGLDGGVPSLLLEVSAQDLAGNGITQERTLGIDTAGPSASLSPLPVFTPGKDRTIEVAQAIDEGSGLQGCAFERAADLAFTLEAQSVPASGTTSHLFDGLSDGQRYYYRLSCSDALGNTAASAAVFSTQDASPPRTSVELQSETSQTQLGWYAADVTALPKGTDATSGIATTLLGLDGAPEVPWDSALLLQEGNHTLRWWSVDAVGNVEPAQQRSVRIDHTPPTAVLTCPTSVHVAETIHCLSTGSTDSGSGMGSIVWSFGDGTDGSGATTDHAYAAAGTFQLRLVVADLAGNLGDAQQSVTVLAVGENLPPTASVSGPSVVFVGEPSRFDGSGSTDDAPAGLTYRWTLDGDAVGTAQVLVYTFSAPAVARLELTVTDAHGASASAAKALLVVQRGVNAPPVALIDAPMIGFLNESVAFDGSSSLDEDAATLSFSWDFGDGSNDTGASTHHAFEVRGAYTIVLTVTDVMGLQGSAQVGIHVIARGEAVPPLPRIRGPASATVGQEVTFDALLSIDDEPATLQYRWALDGGTTGTGAIVRHTFSAAGTYQITLTVTDADGLSANTTLVVSVSGSGANAPVPLGGILGGWLLPLAAVLLAATAIGALLLTRRRRPAGGGAAVATAPPGAPEVPTAFTLGLNHLVKAADLSFFYRGVRHLIDQGATPVILTATFPTKLRALHGIPQPSTIVWLTDISSVEATVLRPRSLEFEMLEQLRIHLRSGTPHPLVAIDCLEYLIETNGTSAVAEFLGALSGWASGSGGTLVVAVRQGALAPSDLAAIESRFDRVLSPEGVSVPRAQPEAASAPPQRQQP